MSEDIVSQLQEELRLEKSKNAQLNTALASSSFGNADRENVIQYQLDSSELLQNLEHFLRGEYVQIDDEGNEGWVKPLNADLIILNDYGVSAIMSIIGSYVDKGTALSTYSEMRINEILGDIGDELAKWIYCNYERIGMNTEFKKTRYQLLVINILHLIESAYRKAIGGQTREDLNSSKIFTESGFNGMARMNPAQTTAKKPFNPFKPSTWR